MAPRKFRRTHASIVQTADFLDFLHRGLTPGIPSTLTGLWFSRQAEGTLHLDEAEAKAYRALVDHLDKDFNSQQDISRRAIERLLQDAVFHALDIAGQSTKPFEDRERQAMALLEESLSAPPVRFRCFMPVDGFAFADLPISFGRIRFVRFGASHRRQLAGRGEARRESDRWKLANTIKEGKLWHKPCAVITLAARDSDTARSRARLTTQAVLDEMNFFADLIPYNYAWLRQPGGVASAVESAAIASETSLSLPDQSMGPLGPFAVKQLTKRPWLHRTFRLLSALSRRAKARTVGELLLVSFRWAGRASVESRREQSFLLFAIALEAAILPERQHQELTYRLGIRVARLLGKNPFDRKDIHRSLARLYGVRSTIVHSGDYEVTDEDLGLLRALTKRVLVRLLRRRKGWNERPTALASWLDGLVTK